MKRFITLALVLTVAATVLPSCGPTDKSQANLPEGVGSKRELRAMKENPQDYDPAALEAAGLDPSLGTPGGIGAPGGGGEAAAGAEGGEGQ